MMFIVGMLLSGCYAPSVIPQPAACKHFLYHAPLALETVTRDNLCAPCRRKGIGMELPQLPESEYGLCFFDEGGAHAAEGVGYTADQMHAFRAAGVAQAIEACAKLCEEDAFVDQWKGLEEAARRIRATLPRTTAPQE